MPKAAGKQREDLARFGRLVQRQPTLRLVSLRNSGRMTNEEFNRLVELMDLANEGIIQTLLDSFDAQVDIARALNELEPLPQQCRQVMLRENHIWLRGYLDRVEAALRYLKADPR